MVSYNLNIYYESSKETWDQLIIIYQAMPNWIGFIDGIPHWFSDGSGEKVITASVETSGLQFCVELSDEEWVTWFTIFKEKSSKKLGFEIGEIENGYNFHLF